MKYFNVGLVVCAGLLAGAASAETLIFDLDVDPPDFIGSGSTILETSTPVGINSISMLTSADSGTVTALAGMATDESFVFPVDGGDLVLFNTVPSSFQWDVTFGPAVTINAVSFVGLFGSTLNTLTIDSTPIASFVGDSTTFTPNLMTPAGGGPFSYASGETVTFDYEMNTITAGTMFGHLLVDVTVIPEPGSVLLMATCLGGLAFIRRRRSC